MTQQEFEELVNRLENYAKRQPTNYKIQVGLLAILGHVYIVLILALLMALIAALIVISIYTHQVSAAIIKLVIVLCIPVFPCLSDRLKALHFSPEDATMMLGSIPENAAESLLGKEHLPLTEKLNEHRNTNVNFMIH